MLLKFLKRALLLILFLIVAFIIVIEVYSIYRVNQLGLKKDNNHGNYSQVMSDVFLFSVDEPLDAELSSFYVSEYLLAFGLTGLFYDQAYGYKFMPEGSLLSYQLVRAMQGSGDIKFKNHNIDSLIVGSWVSKNYTTQEALNYYLDSVYMGVKQGQGVIGLKDASQFYFSKKDEDLNFSEIVALSVVSFSPSRFRNCKRDGFLYEYEDFLHEKSSELTYWLKEKESQKYSKYDYKRVYFKHCE